MRASLPLMIVSSEPIHLCEALMFNHHHDVLQRIVNEELPDIRLGKSPIVNTELARVQRLQSSIMVGTGRRDGKAVCDSPIAMKKGRSENRPLGFSLRLSGLA